MKEAWTGPGSPGLTPSHALICQFFENYYYKCVLFF